MGDGRPGWDTWAMCIAYAVSTRADCTRRRVGAVVLDSSHRIISTGYNGTAPGRLGCLSGGCPRGQHTFDEIPAGAPYDEPGGAFCIATHAEMNAILYADPLQLGDATLYVTTEPCKWCGKVIANTAIRRIIFPNPEDKNKLVIRLV